ncbi:MFS transporter [Microbacterium sp. CH12i]|uniref:MFS transporter n=1 Tax=Microbacterium sp. CH12i TaxID=1479651 RepID=UPI000460F076|nr:MFS transporter [Microbacterium sp. CH12i]KDA05340.1 MFS transporter [Microbacterium sp. CH12i]
MADQSKATTTTEPSQAGRVWASSFIGGAIEFYDFSIYSTAASLVFASLFFSELPPAIGLVASFGTLAAGYAARPIGGIIFGHFGDKVGRKKTLIITIVVMGLATFLVGLLPTTAMVGPAAAVMLITLRLIQGLAVGGEWGGGVVLTSEHAPKGRRALMGTATTMGSAAGLLLGFGAFAIVIPATGDNFMTWGWRIPFLVTVVLFILAIYMRLRVKESETMVKRRAEIIEAEAAGQKFENPFGAVLRSNWRWVIIGALIFTGPFLIQNLMLTFWVAYSVGTSGISQGTIVNVGMIALAVCLVLLPVAAMLGDKYGQRKVILWGIGLQVINSILVVPMLSSGSFGMLITSYVLVFAIHAFILGPLTAVYVELFPTKNRYTGVSVTYQLASLLGGGLGPLAAQSLFASGVNVWPIALGVTVLCAVAFLATLTVRKSEEIDLHDIADDGGRIVEPVRGPAAVSNG